MNQDQDPSDQANFLRQCLSHDNRPLGILLGAGCPTAIRIKTGGSTRPLIPDIAGLTALVAHTLASSDLKHSYETVISHFRADGLPDPNIEQLLSHVRSLRRVAGRDSVRGVSSEDLDSLDDAICSVIADACKCSLPRSATPYHLIASWVGAIERAAPVEIFTTNYDLLMEQALEGRRVPYFDGFVGTHEAFFDLQSMEDKLPPRWARLWKIHGSLDWHEDESGSIRRSRETQKGHVIYPSHLKYDETRRMPYLAMVDRLRAFLLQNSAVLVTSGFSFSDDHLNEVMIQGLQGNRTSIAYALVYGKLERYGKVTKLADNRPNMTVMAADGGVIGTRHYRWTRGRVAQNCSDTVAVEWLDDSSKPGLRDAMFTLGDFARLSEFLEDMLGEQGGASRA